MNRIQACIPICVLLTMLTTDDPAAQPSPARAYRQAHEAEILRDFAELLAIPNVSSDAEDIRRNAEYLKRGLEHRGARAELWQIEGAPPIVFGELEAQVPSERTLGIYVHYDGQPVNAVKWTSPPFEPTLYTAAIDAPIRRSCHARIVPSRLSSARWDSSASRKSSSRWL